MSIVENEFHLLPSTFVFFSDDASYDIEQSNPVPPSPFSVTTRRRNIGRRPFFMKVFNTSFFHKLSPWSPLITSYLEQIARGRCNKYSSFKNTFFTS